jgi:small-conductance mechanosensitive channel
MEEFFVEFGGYETQLLVMALGAAFNVLLALGIYLWVRRFLRAWAKRTQIQVDQQIATITEYFLLPILALGAAYGLDVLGVSPKGFGIGKKVILGAIVVLALWLGARLSLLFIERQAHYYAAARVLALRLRGPIWATMATTLFYTLLVHLAVPPESWLVLPRMSLIIAFTWLLWRGVTSAGDMAHETYVKRLEAVDPSRARSFDTLVVVLRRVANFVVVLIATVAVLNQFEFFETLTRSILASAGIAGLVIGLAAQRTLGNLFAGVQLALSQPVTKGDSVIFEGEWGWIEVYTDYRIDVEAVRQELGRILESTPLWNQKVPPVLQTTDCKEQTVELRALCSASSASGAWDLRCLVREKLLAYIQQVENGRFLPRTRVEFERQAIQSV